MKTALGFIFGKIGLQENQVPKDIQLYDSIDQIQMTDKELVKALVLYYQKFTEKTSQYQKMEKILPLKQENKELLKALYYE